MADIMNDVDALFAMAVKADKAPPLDTAAVMRRVSLLSTAGQATATEPSLRFFVGLGSVAAAIAVVVTGLVASTWAALHDPFQVIQTLPDILSLLNI